MDFAQIHKRLQEIADECSEEGWDGYGAHPVKVGALLRVCHFLMNLEDGLPTPDISPVPDGDVDMVWEGWDGRCLVVFWAPGIGGWHYIFREDENDRYPWQSGPDGLLEKLDLFREKQP